MNDMFKLWDTVEKNYLQKNDKHLIFFSLRQAEDYRFDWLQEGNYPDRPITVISVHRFRDGKFIEDEG
jgi:hypothetical protein